MYHENVYVTRSFVQEETEGALFYRFLLDVSLLFQNFHECNLIAIPDAISAILNGE